MAKFFRSTKVEKGLVTIEGKQYKLNVPDGNYDIAVWGNGELSVYVVGTIDESFEKLFDLSQPSESPEKSSKTKENKK